MKNKLVIGISAALCGLMAVLPGCSPERERQDESSFLESEYSTESPVSDNNSDYTENSDNDIGVLKSFDHTVDTKGLTVYDLKQSSLYLMAMDNDNFYFSSETFPVTISSVDRNDRKSNQDILKYDLDVEIGLANSKRTYCGHYVTFPCCGSPYDEYVTLRCYVGKPNEQSRCILEQPTSAISVCACELNANEMVFLCSGETRGTFNIYKYNFDEEQAQLIYTTELEVSSQNSNPLINCFNGEIYFIYRSSQNETTYCIKRINTNGEVCDETLLELPSCYKTTMHEFTVTENNIFIRFEPTEDGGCFQTVMVDKKTHKTISDIGDNGLGVRFNDRLIDGRYILFRAGSKSNPNIKMVCLFDDWTSEFHFIKFSGMNGAKILNTVADPNGDIVFFVHENDEEDINTLIQFEDIRSLIAST